MTSTQRRQHRRVAIAGLGGMLALIGWTNACVGEDPPFAVTSTPDGGSIVNDGGTGTVDSAPDAPAYDFSFEPATFDLDPGQTTMLRVRGSPELATVVLVLAIDPLPDAGVPASAVALGASSVSLATGEAIVSVQAVPNAPQQRFRVIGTAGSVTHEARGRITGKPGELDVFFGDRGGYLEIAPGGDCAAHAVAVQPDGRFVVAGTTPVNDNVCVARFTPEGALDTSFGPDGSGSVTLGQGLRPRLELMPDGSIAIAASLPNQLKLFRVGASGTPDPAWGGTAGITPALKTSSYHRAALGKRGDLLFVAGNAAEQAAAVQRYLPDGTLDTSFGDAGTVAFSLDERIGKSPFVDALAVEPTGAYWIAGNYRVGDPPRPVTLVRRFQADGTDYDAYVAGTYDGGATDLALQSGKAVVGAFHSSGSSYELVAFRVTNEHDPMFGTGGKASIPRPSGSFVTSMVVDASERIYLVNGGPTADAFEVFRLTPIGQLDASFGQEGVFQLPTGRAHGAAIAGRQLLVVGADDAVDQRRMRIARIWL